MGLKLSNTGRGTRTHFPWPERGHRWCSQPAGVTSLDPPSPDPHYGPLTSIFHPYPTPHPHQVLHTTILQPSPTPYPHQVPLTTIIQPSPTPHPHQVPLTNLQQPLTPRPHNVPLPLLQPPPSRLLVHLPHPQTSGLSSSMEATYVSRWAKER